MPGLFNILINDLAIAKNDNSPKDDIEPNDANNQLIDSKVLIDKPCNCGGYNEAFIVQFWSSYTPYR